MTFIVFDEITLGPGKLGFFGWDSVFSLYNLDDNNDAVAFAFAVPKDGTITEVGFVVGAKVGTPPEYKVGIVSLDGSTGFPSTSNYGGSSPYAWTPANTTTEFIWFTLATSATANRGDLVAIKVYPDGTVPNTSNYTRIAYDLLFIDDYRMFPRVHRYTTGWNTTGGWSFWGIKYNDGSIYGIPADSLLYQKIHLSTSPNEVGCKFSLPLTVRCIGPTIALPSIDLNAGADLILYDGNDNILRSITFPDFDMISDNYGACSVTELKWDSPVTLSGDSTYRVTIKSTVDGSPTLSGIYFSGIIFDDPTSRSGNLLGMFNSWQMTERTGSGAWTDYNDRSMSIGIHIDAVDVTISGGGDGVVGGAYAYVG